MASVRGLFVRDATDKQDDNRTGENVNLTADCEGGDSCASNAEGSDGATMDEGLPVRGRWTVILVASGLAVAVASCLVLVLFGTVSTRPPAEASSAGAAQVESVSLDELPPAPASAADAVVASVGSAAPAPSVTPATSAAARGAGCDGVGVASGKPPFTAVGRGFCSFDQSLSRICKTGGWTVTPCTLEACYQRCAHNSCCLSFVWNQEQCHCALVKDFCQASELQTDDVWKRQSIHYNMNDVTIGAAVSTSEAPSFDFDLSMGSWDMDESGPGIPRRSPTSGPCPPSIGADNAPGAAASPVAVPATTGAPANIGAPMLTVAAPVATVPAAVSTVPPLPPPANSLAAAPAATADLVSPAAPSGACTGAGDRQIFAIVTKPQFDATMKSCGTSCIGATACTADCFRKEHDYTEACATCFGQLATCTRNNCWWQCSFDAASADCVTCADNGCMPDYRTCAGFKHVPGGGGDASEAARRLL